MSSTTRIIVLLAVLLLPVHLRVLHAKDIPPARQQMSAVAETIEKAIRDGKVPGAVVLVGSQDKMIFRKSFGDRALVPERLPMMPDTVFDISSLTKVIATTTAVMQLVERGKLHLDQPVKKYWPQFKGKGKEKITVKQLLTHYSGLRASIGQEQKWSGYDDALRLISEEKPLYRPGERFLYSDINFIVLGELVRRISGEKLDVYCRRNIFGPLGMKDTCFRPPATLKTRIAPTEYLPGGNGRMLRGEVHDATARRMGGVAGHAGLFSTADDLSIFAQMILEGGKIGDVRILDSKTVKKMTRSQSPPGKTVLRGLGWDIESPFSSCRGSLFPLGSFGHTGFTGTSLWIDPGSRTYLIILTSRLHPDGNGDVRLLRAEIATLVASALRVKGSQGMSRDERSAGYISATTGKKGIKPDKVISVRTGIDILKEDNFKSLSDLAVGLVTNHSGIDSSGKSTVDILRDAPGVKLRAMFSPEHGISGKEEGEVPSSVDVSSDLPVYSLYGAVKRPTEEMLEGLDALVFDIQDVGVRFYTYISTLGYVMEAAAKKGIPLYVLDRPNPIGASTVQGFISDGDIESFTAYYPLPVRYGMTAGEVARMFNEEKAIGADLRVIAMRGYERSVWYDETGLLWTNPSPNIRSLRGAVLYPGVALVEGANVSVGRGTETPFELVGAPWIEGEKLSAYLNSRRIAGVRFLPVSFTPSESRYKGRRCRGVRVILLDRDALDPPALGIEIIFALRRLHPKEFRIDMIRELLASRETFQALKEGRDPDVIVGQWKEGLERFARTREKYLLY